MYNAFTIDQGSTLSLPLPVIITVSRFSWTGFSTYVIGVGGNLNQSEVEAIASDPDSKYLIEVADFSLMESIIDDIVAATCAESSEYPSLLVSIPRYDYNLQLFVWIMFILC